MNNKPKNKFKILAIETSCDETSAAVLEVTNSTSEAIQRVKRLNILNIKILSNIISSQVKIHAKYGGVYPELASREHVKNILPVIKEATYSQFPISNSQFPINFQKNNFQIDKLKHYKLNKNLKLKIKNYLNDIDYLAVTTGPGLIGSLLVGVETAKTLSYVFNKPIISVNHLEGHIYSNFVGESCHPEVKPKDLVKRNQETAFGLDSSLTLRMTNNNYPKFPLICLIVSGGHTSLVYMKSHLDYKIIGETLDDAAGEAYDKVASMLGLTYPGGPAIDTIASKLSVIARSPGGTTKQSNTRSPRPIRTRDDKDNIKVSQLQRFQRAKRLNKLNELFPRPMLDKNNFDFSFSGLKTSVLYYLKKQKQPYPKKLIQRTCYEFQEAATDVLVTKTLKAAKAYQVKSILVCGGVSANQRLRKKFQSTIENYNIENSLKIKNLKLKINLFIPKKSLCTDNAAMIGAAATYKILYNKDIVDWNKVEADSNLYLE